MSMLRVLLVSSVRENLTGFAAGLSADAEVSLGWAESGKTALEIARTEHPHLVVIDEALADAAPLDLVIRLLAVDAMINTVVVSAAPDEEFHQMSEGLGVVARLAPRPGPEEAVETLASLRRLNPAFETTRDM